MHPSFYEDEGGCQANILQQIELCDRYPEDDTCIADGHEHKKNHTRILQVYTLNG